MSKQARSRQPTPLTNFPAWPAYPASSPSSSKNSALPIFPVGPPAAQICAADFSHWWHRCHFPSLRPDHQYFSSSLRLRIVQQLACRGQRRRAGPSSAQPLPRGRQPRAQGARAPSQPPRGQESKPAGAVPASGLVAQRSMAAWGSLPRARAPNRPIAQGPPRAPGPQAPEPQALRPQRPSAQRPSAQRPAPQRPSAPAPSAGAGGRARARACGDFYRAESGRSRSSPGGIGSKPVVAGRNRVESGRRRPENGSSMAALPRAMRPPTLVRV